MKMTVKDVARLTGVSVRTLQYYDSLGLLKPQSRTESGYRIYDGESLDRLKDILLFRELDFSLSEIKRILDNPGFDRTEALEKQIALLTLKRDRLDRLIIFAQNLKGDDSMDFKVFDKEKIESYANEAKKQWGVTDEYREFSEKSKGRSQEAENAIGAGLISIFKEFGEIKNTTPEGEGAAALVKKLQSYITDNYYNCTDEILLSLGEMYACGGEFTENIDSVGGEGTAIFARDAIAAKIKR